MKFSLLVTKSQKEYELLDSGEGEKLERYGKYRVRRPDPQALWSKSLSRKDWDLADAFFQRDAKNAGWKFRGTVPERWAIELSGLKFWIHPSSFKHTGIFPEQSENWSWIEERVRSASRKISVLNLFGYTGGATLAAAQAGAEVCHVDGSKVAIRWARDNASISGLENKPIRWILDDARTFVGREIKRGRHYDGIIMDPPIFGHGPEGELWKIEEHFIELLSLCQKVLSPQPAFFLLNGYASGYSALAYKNNLEQAMQPYNGATEMGELALEESLSGRLLPAGIFARWQREAK